MKFKVEKLLGSGTFGRVFLVSELSTSKFYALKEMNKSRDNKLSFEMEVNILKLIESRCENNMLCYIDSWIDEKYCILTNYIVGFNLNEYKESFDPFIFIDQLLNVLENLQKLGIAHRDIKPLNIMYNQETKYFTLIDFGVSTDKNDNNNFGSSGYITQEIFETAINPKIRTIESFYKNDVFALGVTLFRLLNKTFPYYTLQGDVNSNNRYRKIGCLDYNRPRKWVWDEDREIIRLVNMMLEGKYFAYEIK